jgi:hypothetical protein
MNVLRFSHQATSIPTNHVRNSSKSKLCVTKPKWKPRLLVVNYYKFLFSLRVISQFPQAMSNHAKCWGFLEFLFNRLQCMQEDFVDISTHPDIQSPSSLTLHMIQLCYVLPLKRWLISTHFFSSCWFFEICLCLCVFPFMLSWIVTSFKNTNLFVKFMEKV